MIIVYGKESCRFCKNTLQALKTFNIPFEYKTLDKDYSKEDFLEVVPNGHNTFPAIFEGENFLGGFSEFKSSYFS
jgi:glutaredoxin